MRRDLSPIGLKESRCQKLREDVERAGDFVARIWPLGAFIYRNPLQGLEHLPFDEAVRQGNELFGGQGYLSNETYRRFYRAGRITDDSVEEALRRSGILGEGDFEIQIGSKRIGALEVLRLQLVHGIEGLEAAAANLSESERLAFDQFLAEVVPNSGNESDSADLSGQWADGSKEYGSHPASENRIVKNLPWDLARLGQDQTVGEWIQGFTDLNLVDLINDQMVKWCSAFLDEGMAAWPMPVREKGFYTAWRELGCYDPSAWFLGLRDLSEKIQRLPELPEDTIAVCLDQLGVREESWTDYFKRHLVQLPGWAGFIKWRAGEPDYPWQKKYPIDLFQYLAIRLFYEVEFVETTCRKKWGIKGTIPEIRAYFGETRQASALREIRQNQALFYDNSSDSTKILREAWRYFGLARLAGLTNDELRHLSRESMREAIALLDAFPSKNHGPVWLEALELSYRQGLFHKLAARECERQEPVRERPWAQAVFCIDARSEGLRRYLEGLGSYETLGFAGFFGVPICYRPYDSDEELLLCPALIKPNRIVVEAPLPGHGKEVQRHETGSNINHLGHGLFHDLKANNLTAYFLIDVLGVLSGLGFIGKALFPQSYDRLKEKIHSLIQPPVPTVLMIDQAPEEPDLAQSSRGFTLSEQAAFVENGLRMMGLTQNFARVVLLCAHGSRAENNPYAAAYDCGACGGNHGGPNARTLASMANKSGVRDIVRERGIDIPSDTVFIAAEHNTTTDRVVLLDRERISPSYKEDVARLESDLYRAGMMLARERAGRLPGSPGRLSPERAFRHVKNRSVDWSQVRPEWGLSSNAAFIIGRRALTRGINLEGRAFMHSYDFRVDSSGKALETIMTAPLLVVQWISMEYYFSSVDNPVYGSNSKVIHNVVGGIGVMLGRQSDLQPGLPLQSVMNGSIHYHEPMRPLVIIEAPRSRVIAIIERHGVLQNLFDNQWVNLIILEDPDGEFLEYRQGGRWERVYPERAEVG